MTRKLIDTIDEYDWDGDGMADLTIILRNGEKGIYVSFRAVLATLAALAAWSTGIVSSIL